MFTEIDLKKISPASGRRRIAPRGGGFKTAKRADTDTLAAFADHG
jgi:hypothetical protein